jgi:hypothetical protein
MLFSTRGGNYKVLMRVWPYNSYTRRWVDDWCWRMILLILQWFWDDWGGYLLLHTKSSCLVVDGGVRDSTRGRRNQGLEIWDSDP